MNLTIGTLNRALDKITPLKAAVNPADATDPLVMQMVAMGFKLRESEHIPQRTAYISTPDQFVFLNFDTKVANVAEIPDWMKL